LRLNQGNQAPPGHNLLQGKIASTLVTGGTSKHFVTLESGETIAIQELTNQNTARLQPGLSVAVSWPESAARFLRQ